jgi:hypothetical protein
MRPAAGIVARRASIRRIDGLAVVAAAGEKSQQEQHGESVHAGSMPAGSIEATTFRPRQEIETHGIGAKKT